MGSRRMPSGGVAKKKPNIKHRLEAANHIISRMGTKSVPVLLYNIDSHETKMSSCRILLFGDLSVACEDDVRALLHIRDNPLLSSFFEQVGARIRDEIGCLGTQRQALFPRFTTLIDLASKLGETEGTPILRFCLLSICQIGQFLEYVDKLNKACVHSLTMLQLLQSERSTVSYTSRYLLPWDLHWIICSGCRQLLSIPHRAYRCGHPSYSCRL